jgi:DegV family protein with EDD domain
VIHLVTDSTCDIGAEEAKRLGVTVVPLVVRFGKEEFRDGVDLSSGEFYKRLAAGTNHPTTSQPSPDDFMTVYKSLLRSPDDSVVSIHISQKMSGTLQSASVAAQQLGGERIHLIDSEAVTAGLQLLVIAAAEDIGRGMDAKSVAEATLRRRAQVNLFCLLDTLTYLQRGGRIGRATAVVGGLLNVKPLLTMEHGEVAPLSRVRSRKKGIEMIIELLRAKMPLRRLAVFHAGAPEVIDELRATVTAAFPGVDVVVGQVGPVVGTYAGPGGLGVAYQTAQ